jgi:hypothetical protein
MGQMWVHHAGMNDRRMKRSTERTEALQYLVEALADRSGARALVLLDDTGRIVAGTGMPQEVVSLARAARDVAWRRATPDMLASMSHDVTARPVATREGMLYFAALSEQMTGLGDAVRAVQRILAA